MTLLDEQALEAYMNELETIPQSEENSQYIALCRAYANAPVYQPEHVSGLRFAILELAASMGLYRATVVSGAAR